MSNVIPYTKGTEDKGMYGVYKGDKLLFQYNDYERAKGVAHGYNHYYCMPCYPDLYTVKIITPSPTKKNVDL